MKDAVDAVVVVVVRLWSDFCGRVDVVVGAWRGLWLCRAVLCFVEVGRVYRSDWDDLGEQVQKGFSNDCEAYFQQDLSDELGAYTITDVQPHLLKAKLEADPDNPTYTLKQCRAHTSVSGGKQWERRWTHSRHNWMPGLSWCAKARFCVRGDRQIEGVNFFETWSPVVQWTTVWSMLSLASKLGLKSAQADITAAFVHAPLDPGEEIYVKQPKGHEPCYKLGSKNVSSKLSVYQASSPQRLIGQPKPLHCQRMPVVSVLAAPSTTQLSSECFYTSAATPALTTLLLLYIVSAPDTPLTLLVVMSRP
eukprot:scaffold16518_cov36-Cyclotella_meneghiniana.AAC.2